MQLVAQISPTPLRRIDRAASSACARKSDLPGSPRNDDRTPPPGPWYPPPRKPLQSADRGASWLRQRLPDLPPVRKTFPEEPCLAASMPSAPAVRQKSRERLLHCRDDPEVTAIARHTRTTPNRWPNRRRRARRARGGTAPGNSNNCRTTPDSFRKRVVAPFAFVSVLAGTMLALEVVRRRTSATNLQG